MQISTHTLWPQVSLHLKYSWKNKAKLWGKMKAGEPDKPHQLRGGIPTSPPMWPEGGKATALDRIGRNVETSQRPRWALWGIRPEGPGDQDAGGMQPPSKYDEHGGGAICGGRGREPRLPDECGPPTPAITAEGPNKAQVQTSGTPPGGGGATTLNSSRPPHSAFWRI